MHQARHTGEANLFPVAPAEVDKGGDGDSPAGVGGRGRLPWGSPEQAGGVRSRWRNLRRHHTSPNAGARGCLHRRHCRLHALVAEIDHHVLQAEEPNMAWASGWTSGLTGLTWGWLDRDQGIDSVVEVVWGGRGFVLSRGYLERIRRTEGGFGAISQKGFALGGEISRWNLLKGTDLAP